MNQVLNSSKESNLESCEESGWTLKQQILLNQWCNDVQNYKNYHNYACEFYMSWYHIVGVSKIVLATIAASSLFGNIGTNASEWLKIAQGSVVMLTAILGALQQFFNFGKLAENHNQASTCYYILYLEISKELTLSRTFGNNEFLENVHEEISNLRKTCPSISSKIIARANFNKKNFENKYLIQNSLFNLKQNPEENKEIYGTNKKQSLIEPEISIEEKLSNIVPKSTEKTIEATIEEEKESYAVSSVTPVSTTKTKISDRNLLKLERRLAQRQRRRMPSDLPPNIRYQLERQDYSV
jgi:hypothetical protein